MGGKEELSEKSIDLDPYVQFRKWYNEHLESDAVIPETVTLGTASAEGRVSARTVLLKNYDEKGFIFFTNYNSKKGLQIAGNPSAALLFYWSETSRQIRIEGIIAKLSEKELKSLYEAIKKVLTLAVKLGGESFSDYRKPDGTKGDFDDERQVYKREGQNCSRCGTKIKRMQVGQRSAFFCPNCQKL